MPTGEFHAVVPEPRPLVTHSSPFPLWLLWGAVGLAASAGVAWATSVGRIGALEKQDVVILDAAAKDRESAEKQGEKVQVQAVEFGIIKTDIKYIREAVERMERGGRRPVIRSAGGREE